MAHVQKPLYYQRGLRLFLYLRFIHVLEQVFNPVFAGVWKQTMKSLAYVALKARRIRGFCNKAKALLKLCQTSERDVPMGIHCVDKRPITEIQEKPTYDLSNSAGLSKGHNGIMEILREEKCGK